LVATIATVISGTKKRSFILKGVSQLSFLVYFDENINQRTGMVEIPIYWIVRNILIGIISVEASSSP